MANDMRREGVVVDVKDGAHDQMEVDVYVFKMNRFISFPHPTGFPAYSFITLRVINETGYQATINPWVERRLYGFSAKERECGDGVEDFVLKAVFNTNWVLEKDWTEDHFFVDHLTLGLVKVPHNVWGEGRKKQVKIGRLQPSENHNGKECHFIVEEADKYDRKQEDSDDDYDSDDSEDSDYPAFWKSTEFRRRQEREARGQRRIE